jgi:Flp pilus assembly protein TadG
MRRAQQRGAALVLVMVGLVALIAMAGLAIDTGHLGLNKARLQSTVDAAALAAAKVLDQTSGAEQPASDAALSVLGINAADHPELSQVVDNGLEVTIQYSNTLDPFVPGTVPAFYVRVVARNFTMWTGFTALVGMNDMQTAASAVAGPSATIGPLSEVCDIAPMVVCGDPAAPAPFFGFQLDKLQVLKLASGSNPGPIGPGNFQLLRLGGSGGSVVRENMAGAYDSCADGSGTVETQTGNVVGPVTQGLNTRFGEYSGGGVDATDYPPDVVTTTPSPALDATDNPDGTITITQGGQVVTTSSQIDYSFDDYTAQVQAEDYDNQPLPNGTGAPERRVLTVPIGDCSGSNNGNSDLPVLGFGCYFLLQPAVQKGNENYVYGEFIDGCVGDGNPGPEPSSAFGPYRIQLYNDVGSVDS